MQLKCEQNSIRSHLEKPRSTYQTLRKILWIFSTTSPFSNYLNSFEYAVQQQQLLLQLTLIALLYESI